MAWIETDNNALVNLENGMAITTRGQTTGDQQVVELRAMTNPNQPSFPLYTGSAKDCEAFKTELKSELDMLLQKPEAKNKAKSTATKAPPRKTGKQVTDPDEV